VAGIANETTEDDHEVVLVVHEDVGLEVDREVVTEEHEVIAVSEELKTEKETSDRLLEDVENATDLQKLKTLLEWMLIIRTLIKTNNKEN
jgi:hypothetical protein